ncbi:hypothetical protein BRADI_2g22228v3 [Brachypodium distachyon]|uniref:Glucan endo-1,3-beta-D-glucosidase n=1 Tax=Brachypodium distachyon TaxID=15368 RepID=A0A0Q3G384_BRADI|nr:hypothetical protein BRADI_2g22228v3 [Brachypodium distachyon]
MCYGMSADNLPPPSAVVSTFKSNGITSMRLYAPDHATLNALAGTGINVAFGAPNDMLPGLAANHAVAAAWVRSNILAHHPKVVFRYVVVGNEAAGGLTCHLAPAMQNMKAALASVRLGHIVVTTSVSQAILGVWCTPSAGQFNAEADAYMRDVIPALARTGAPLMANIYPYLAWQWNTSAMDIRYALFTAPGVVVQDGAYGYQNLFDTTVDALYGHGQARGVRERMAFGRRTYNQNLINHIGRGTPRHPGPIETYIFAMINEDQKQAGVEQHWGLFYPNMQHVYPIKF